MFKVITTGLNLNYGKKDEERLLGDSYLMVALKKGWITGNVEYVGEVKTFNRLQTIQPEETIMPFKKIDVLKTLEQQTDALNRIKNRLGAIEYVNARLTKTIKGNKNARRKAL